MKELDCIAKGKIVEQYIYQNNNLHDTTQNLTSN